MRSGAMRHGVARCGGIGGAVRRGAERRGTVWRCAVGLGGAMRCGAARCGAVRQSVARRGGIGGCCAARCGAAWHCVARCGSGSERGSERVIPRSNVKMYVANHLPCEYCWGFNARRMKMAIAPRGHTRRVWRPRDRCETLKKAIKSHKPMLQEAMYRNQESKLTPFCSLPVSDRG